MNVVYNIILILLVIACNLLMYGRGYVHGRIDTFKEVEQWIDEIKDEQRDSKQDS